MVSNDDGAHLAWANTFNGEQDIYYTFIEDPVATGCHTLQPNIPGEFKLYQNYPNPFNPTTTIKYNLHKSNDVTLKIYNLIGQELETLVNGFQTAGKHEINWQPNGLPSGIYFYRLQSGEFSQAKKLILQKK